jgi:hypothetical protein
MLLAPHTFTLEAHYNQHNVVYSIKYIQKKEGRVLDGGVLLYEWQKMLGPPLTPSHGLWPSPLATVSSYLPDLVL